MNSLQKGAGSEKLNQLFLKTHREIDQRSIKLARAVAEKIDGQPTLLNQVKVWLAGRPEECLSEWRELLELPWNQVRQALLDESETGHQRRQNSPFVGILTPQERWAIYRDSNQA